MKRKTILIILMFRIVSPLATPSDTSDNFRPLVDDIVTLVEKHFYDSIKVSDSKW